MIKVMIAKTRFDYVFDYIFHRKLAFCHVHTANKMPWYLYNVNNYGKYLVQFFYVSSMARNAKISHSHSQHT